MLTVGKVCVKTAGRDAGQIAVVIDVLDKNLVMIDGQVRRRKCNILHLEPTSKSVNIKKNASHADVVAALKVLEVAVVDRKPKAKAPKQKRVAAAKKALTPKQAAKTSATSAKSTAKASAQKSAAKPAVKSAAKK